MHTVIFGANGGTGRKLVAAALEAGHTVTAAVRRPEDFDVVHPRLTVSRVDVYEPDQVDAVITPADAVVSSLGVPYSRRRIEVYSRGTANIVTAMRRRGVRRLIVTSSSATDPAVRFKNSGGGMLLEVLKPLVVFVLGRTTYADMRRMESLVRGSGLDHTIVRPSGLFDAAEVSDYLVAEDHIRGAFTARIDLADFMIAALDDVGWIGRTAAVATMHGAPTVLDFFRSEALS
ncbi:MAG TPA: NAD(P)H-binding protein [Amnibacterium sp.]|jgi:putative NADH-flavin reductase|nr:NAD(P)H-binding protein [Amnibacterium sp.]